MNTLGDDALSCGSRCTRKTRHDSLRGMLCHALLTHNSVVKEQISGQDGFSCKSSWSKSTMSNNSSRVQIVSPMNPRKICLRLHRGGIFN